MANGKAFDMLSKIVEIISMFNYKGFNGQHEEYLGNAEAFAFREH
jgi:hypothetical protein